MKYPKDFGVWLKHLRIREGLTQEGLADVLFVPVATVRGWEQGHTLPTGKNWRKLKNRYYGDEVFDALEAAYITAKRLSRV